MGRRVGPHSLCQARRLDSRASTKRTGFVSRRWGRYRVRASVRVACWEFGIHTFLAWRCRPDTRCEWFAAIFESSFEDWYLVRFAGTEPLAAACELCAVRVNKNFTA